MSNDKLSTWADRLTAAAAPTLASPDLSDLRSRPDGFRDELGQHRPVDSLLAAAALGVSAPRRSWDTASTDVRLWAAVTGQAPAIEGLLAPGPGGPLLVHGPQTVLEVLTESELCGLHALWSIARISERSDLRARCLAAAEWHLDELQPDNATNLPWAIHVFVVLAAERSHAAADIDAQTRLHNALAGRGRPDRRAALILHHAAIELRTEAASQ